MLNFLNVLLEWAAVLLQWVGVVAKYVAVFGTAMVAAMYAVPFLWKRRGISAVRLLALAVVAFPLCLATALTQHNLHSPVAPYLERLAAGLAGLAPMLLVVCSAVATIAKRRNKAQVVALVVAISIIGVMAIPSFYLGVAIEHRIVYGRGHFECPLDERVHRQMHGGSGAVASSATEVSAIQCVMLDVKDSSMVSDEKPGPPPLYSGKVAIAILIIVPPIYFLLIPFLIRRGHGVLAIVLFLVVTGCALIFLTHIGDAINGAIHKGIPAASPAPVRRLLYKKPLRPDQFSRPWRASRPGRFDFLVGDINNEIRNTS